MSREGELCGKGREDAMRGRMWSGKDRNTPRMDKRKREQRRDRITKRRRDGDEGVPQNHAGTIFGQENQIGH